jgi:hypothetical protein
MDDLKKDPDNTEPVKDDTESECVSGVIICTLGPDGKPEEGSVEIHHVRVKKSPIHG